MKMYNLLDTSFRTGLRMRTVGGFTQPQRWTWFVLTELEKARSERMKGYPGDLSRFVAKVHATDDKMDADAQLVTLDICGQGRVFQVIEQIQTASTSSRR